MYNLFIKTHVTYMLVSHISAPKIQKRRSMRICVGNLKIDIICVLTKLNDNN